MDALVVAVLPIVRGTPRELSSSIGNPLEGVGSFVAGQIVDAVTGLLRALSEDFLKHLVAPVANYVLHTPDLLAERTLRQFWAVSLAALTACLALLIAISAVAMIPGQSSRFAMAARDALSTRLVACALTAAVSLPLVALEVELANRLVDAFVAEGFAAGDNPLWTALARAVSGDAGAGLALLVTTVVSVVLLVALVVVALARWATLWLLVVLAPIAMGFGILPGGAGVVRVWWRLQLATVFLPLANAVLLGTYVAMFASEKSGLVGALSGVAVLVLMTKLPAWVAGAVVGVEAAELTQRVRRGGRSARRAVVITSGAFAGGSASAAAASRSRQSHIEKSPHPVPRRVTDVRGTRQGGE
ncbi:MAG TPA: hypothetical protein VNB24_08990 [Acidimicrobiales bacterium]|nr:hypothetical protein [Acidimicrobiales bacterium]